MAGSLGGAFPVLRDDRLEVVSVLINDVCNLRCKHCYLGPRTGDPLDPSEWRQFFASLFSSLAPSVLCFAGKEPFIRRDSVRIWIDAIRLRDQIQRDRSRRTAIGVITNGTRLLQHEAALLASPPDYLDISIDGLPETHDRVRGSGAFGLLEPNLQWVMKAMPERVRITHTLFGQNVLELPRFVEMMHQTYGLERFSLGTYQQLEYTDQTLALGPRLCGLVEAINGLAQIPGCEGVEVVVEIGPRQRAEAGVMAQFGWVPSRHPFSSDVIALPNGVQLRVNFGAVPTGIWRAVRVSTGGHWVAAEDLFEPALYSINAVASLRQLGFAADLAYEQGLTHVRFHQLIDDFTGEFEAWPYGVRLLDHLFEGSATR